MSAASRLLLKGRAREWFLLISSLLAIFWLQPQLPVRGLDFWLPLLAVFLSILSWVFTCPPAERWTRENAITAAVIAGLVMLLALTRGTGLEGYLTPSTPPPAVQVAIAILFLLGCCTLAAWRLKPGWGLSVGILFLILILVALKTPALAYSLSLGLRALEGQGIANASSLDLRWLGFSYLAFRLIHTLRDRQTQRRSERSAGQPAVNLREYLVYVLFFPAYSAGPIDRLERFQKDLRGGASQPEDDFIQGGRRLALGLFKKFILADGLALMALSATNAAQVRTSGWAWLMLYAYTFQIFLDFSGYTDIALGLGRLLGFRLPENFNSPYLKPNLTQFWNNWHMTLTTWFRGYFFNPLTRSLRRTKLNPSAVLFLMQVSTMVLIGLWHGVSWNFIIWGLWHGVGLFLQNRWSEWVAPRLEKFAALSPWNRLLPVGGVFLTFHYVALGWVWFALPAPNLSLAFFSLLLGGR